MITTIVIGVLYSSHCMSDSLQVIHNGAREMIGWICFVFGTVTMVSDIELASIKNLVSETLELVVLILFTTNTVPLCLFGTVEHVFKHFKVEFNCM